MGNFIKEFRAFVLRGNVLDLAVAVILGIAFGLVIKSFTEDILLAIIAVIFGKPSFADVIWTINGGQIKIGLFIDAVINFVIVAFALFVVIRSVNAMQARRARGEAVEDAPAPAEDVVLLGEIRDLLKARA